MKTVLLASSALLWLAPSSFAQQDTHRPDIITVIGLNGDVDRLHGSASVLTDEDLSLQSYSDISRIVRAVPGVNVQEEDGYGLRPNIGLRGTGLDRSEKITLMEDGILMAPAPYAAPSAYYFPHSGRMAGVEIIKGAAGVRYGPRTQGGSLNLLSTPVPETFAGRAEVSVGEEDQRRIHAYLGGMKDLDNGLRIGGLVEGFYNHADGFKALDNSDASTGFDLNDFVGKLRLEARAFNADHSFELKGQISDEVSNETYLGLTAADFAVNPYRRYAASAHDEMNADHEELSLRWHAAFDNGLNLSAVAYRTEFGRDWFKLDKVDSDGRASGGSVSISSILDDPNLYRDEYQILTGSVDSPADSLLIKHNNRAYQAKGIQLELDGSFTWQAVDVVWRLGTRLHEDEMDRFQWVDGYQMRQGGPVVTSLGVAGTDSNRIDSAEAQAIFAQADFTLDRLTITPGLRYERVELLRRDFGKADIDRTGVNLSTKKNTVDWFAPGLGLHYQLNDVFAAFGGVHRGYAPPAPGSTTSKEEKALNWEAGLRYDNNVWRVEAVGFFNDYQNILGSCTNSTGGGCTIGDQFDGGEVEVKGLELASETDLAQHFDLSFAMPVRVAYTYTDAEFQTGFVSDYEPWGSVEAGDKLPYIPEHQLYASLGLEWDRLGAQIAANWVDVTRTTAGQGSIPVDAKLDSRIVADLALWMDLTQSLQARLNVRNLFDETYIAAYRPAGLRPGAPQAVSFGLTLDF